MNLVPNFILEKYNSDERNGRFLAAALFVDISGFSTVTDQLMQHGQHGAEVLAGVMGAIFEPLINAVYGQGGFVTGFAGDAFTAVFSQSEGGTPAQALAAAASIQSQMQANPDQQTAYGTFTMSAKVGVALGEIIWGIVTSEDGSQASYYFQGSAIDRSAESEGVAKPGDIILTEPFYQQVRDSVVVEALDGHYRLTAVTRPFPPARFLEAADPDPELVSLFVPEAAVQTGRTGEFRQVVNLFISLPTVRTDTQLDIFMQTVFRLQKNYGGLLKQLDYGDKGAKLLLFWGAPAAHENDVQRALHFILDLQTQTAIPINGGLTYHVAHAGYIGSSLRGEYTCYGRGVNLAARFMSAAPRGEIWVDEHIARLAGGHFDLDFEGKHSFKGFAEPQDVHILFERKDTADNFYGGHLVGRDDELARLAEFVGPIYEEESRSPGMLVIWGEPGAGKSHLAHAFLTHHLNPGQETAVFLAQSDEILRLSLNPFRYWLKRHFEQSEGLAENRNKRSFNRKLDNLIAETADSAGADLADELDQGRSFLGALVGLSWSDSLYEQLDAKARHEHTLSALTTLLLAESRRQPVILLLEDIHWMDQDSATFLSSLLNKLSQPDKAHLPLAIVATARFEGNALPLEEISYQELNLSELTQTDLASLAQQLLGGPAAVGLLNLLADRTEGNPFFAEQLLRYLQEADQLTLVDGQWQVITQKRSPLPGDVNALLVARLDRLTHSVREVVQTAAVLGREFEIRLLSTILRGDEALTDKITQAERESIWSALNEIRYIFKHALLRDAAYQMQLRARRHKLHQLAMEALELVYADELTNHYGELAYHANAADLPEPAFNYSLLAGQEAMSRYAAAEAVLYYQTAMKLLDQVSPTSDQFLALGTLYGRALELVGDYPAALAQYEVINKIAVETGNQELELASLTALGTIRSTGNVVSDFEQGEVLGKKGLELAAALNDKKAEATILWNLSAVYRNTGRYPEAQEVGERAYDVAEQFGLREQMAYIVNDLNNVYLSWGQIKKSVQNGLKAVTLWRELENQPMLVDGLATYSMVLAISGRFEEAIPVSEEALAISQATNNLWGEAFARYLPAIVHLQRLEIEKGVENNIRALQLARKAGVTVVQGYMGAFHALLYLAGKDYEQSVIVGEEGLAVAEQHIPVLSPMLKGALILAHIELGNLAAAETLANSYEISHDLLVRALLVPEMGKCSYYYAVGNYEAVLAISTAALALAEREDFYMLFPQFCVLHARALAALEGPEKGLPFIEKGLARLREVGGRWGEEALLAAQADLEAMAGS